MLRTIFSLLYYAVWSFSSMMFLGLLEKSLLPKTQGLQSDVKLVDATESLNNIS